MGEEERDQLGDRHVVRVEFVVNLCTMHHCECYTTVGEERSVLTADINGLGLGEVEDVLYARRQDDGVQLYEWDSVRG